MPSERYYYEAYNVMNLDGTSQLGGYNIFERRSEDCSIAIAQAFREDKAALIVEALNQLYAAESLDAEMFREAMKRQIASQ
jgi:hypothetical protein